MRFRTHGRRAMCCESSSFAEGGGALNCFLIARQLSLLRRCVQRVPSVCVCARAFARKWIKVERKGSKWETEKKDETRRGESGRKWKRERTRMKICCILRRRARWKHRLCTKYDCGYAIVIGRFSKAWETKQLRRQGWGYQRW